MGGGGSGGLHGREGGQYIQTVHYWFMIGCCYINQYVVYCYWLWALCFLGRKLVPFTNNLVNLLNQVPGL